MAIPALTAIRGARANAEITVLARPAVADIYCGQPFADKILKYEDRGRHQGFAGRERLIAVLGEGTHD